MRFQFSTSTLMLATTTAAITCAGLFSLMKLDGRSDESLALLPGFIGFTAPLTVPAAFLGFAIGRKSLTVRTVIVFTVAEIAAVAVAYFVNWFY
jgi:hypothetical protein